MSSLNPLNDLSKIYLDTVAKAHKEEGESEVKRWEGYLNKEQKDTPDQVAAVIDMYRSKKGTDAATYDSMHGKKKEAKKERDYAKFERDKMARDAQKSGHRFLHAKGSTTEKEGKKSIPMKKVQDSYEYSSTKFAHLMDAYQSVYNEQKAETPAAEEEKMKKDDDLFGSPNKKKKKKHHCASKVKHEQFGIGNCIKGMHDLDENGVVQHYDVFFEHGIEKNVPVTSLEIVDEAMHEHVIYEEDNTGAHAEMKRQREKARKTHKELDKKYGKKSMKEQKMADKDYDGDGKIESGTDEYMGSRDKAIKKAMGKKKSPESIEAKRRKDDDLAGSPMKEAMMAKKYQKGGMVKGYQKGGEVKGYQKGGMVKGYQKGGMVKGYQKGGMVSKEEVEVDEAMMSMKGYQKGGMVKKYQKGGMVKGYQKGGMVKGYQKGGMVSKEELSNWRDDLIEVSDTVGSGGVPLTDVEAGKKVKEGKVNNKVVINPKLGEAIEQMGGELIEVQEEMNPKKKKKGDQLEVAMEKGKQAIGTLGATTKGTSYAEEDEKFIQKAIKRPGAFTRKAKAAGMSVQQFAKNVDDNPDKYSTRTKRQANLAQTLTKLSKEDVEELFYTLITE